MGEKGMDTSGVSAGGMGAQIGAASAGQESDAQSISAAMANQGPPPPQPPASSGPDAGEIVGDILDPLGIHKLFG
jgi:hypothetical protein